MILRKTCLVKDLPNNVHAQVDMDGKAHYTINDYHRSDGDILQSFMDYLERHGMYPELYTGCAEPGYNDQYVLAADWNDLPNDWQNKENNTRQGNRIEQWLDKRLNISLEWEDEWTRCENCYKAIRSTHDSYHWKPSWLWISDYEIVCHECYKDHVEEIINYYLVTYHYNSVKKAVTSDFIHYLESEGFTCWQEFQHSEESCAHYETGFHEGQNDKPEKVLESVFADSKEWEVIFVTTENSQFYTCWTAYVRKHSEIDEGE